MPIEERKAELEERKKPKNVVIKKNADSKYLAFSKNSKGTGLRPASSQKDLAPIGETPLEYPKRQQEVPQVPEDQTSSTEYWT